MLRSIENRNNFFHRDPLLIRYLKLSQIISLYIYFSMFNFKEYKSIKRLIYLFLSVYLNSFKLKGV